MHETFSQLIAQFGLPLAAFTVAIESIGAPVPGETLMIAMAAAVSAGTLHFWPTFFALLAGSVIGDSIGYLIGKRYGRNAIDWISRRIGVDNGKIDGFERWFRRYGISVVLIARFVVILRQLNGMMAGAFGFSYARFLIANFVGAAAWVAFWLLFAGALAGAVEHWLGPVFVTKLIVFVPLVSIAVSVIGFAAIARRNR